MAYRDPYSDGRQPQYGNSAPEFNPYSEYFSNQTHPSYDQSGYSYDNYGPGGYRDADPASNSEAPGPQRQATMRSFLTSNSTNTRPNFKEEAPPVPLNRAKSIDETSGFDHGEFSGGNPK